MRYIREELVLVLGTSSSESVFSQLTQKLTRLGVDESVVGIVPPTGYSFNHDGTCLYFAAVSVFLAQATDTALGWEQQLALLAVLLITSEGGAGVSGSAITPRDSRKLAKLIGIRGNGLGDSGTFQSNCTSG